MKIYSLFLSILLFGSASLLAQQSYTTNQSINETINNSEDSKLQNTSPIKFGYSYDSELVTNHNGGLKTGSGYFGKAGLNLRLSLSELGIRNGGLLFIHALHVHGDTPTSRLIGDFQPVSRNEASDRFGLFEFWYQHNLANTDFIIGQHDMNSTFGVSRVAGNSIHSAFGVFPSVSPNLGYAYSIYPRTMPGLIVKHRKNQFSVQAALYAGSSQPFNQDKHNLKWNLDDSGFFIVETTYRSLFNNSNSGEFKLGVFKHTAEFDNLVAATANSSLSPDLGFYFIADHYVYANKVSVFAESTYFPGDHNFSSFFYATGLEVKGLFKTREQDTFFLGFLSTSISEAALSLPGFDEANRSIFELNYNLSLANGISIKPDLQYIINPGANSTLDNALVSVIKISYKSKN